MNLVEVGFLFVLVFFAIVGVVSMESWTDKWACEESLPRNVECVYRPPMESEHE